MLLSLAPTIFLSLAFNNCITCSPSSLQSRSPQHLTNEALHAACLTSRRVLTLTCGCSSVVEHLLAKRGSRFESLHPLFFKLRAFFYISSIFSFFFFPLFLNRFFNLFSYLIFFIIILLSLVGSVFPSFLLDLVCPLQFLVLSSNIFEV